MNPLSIHWQSRAGMPAMGDQKGEQRWLLAVGAILILG
jgi:hypothetical protein